ncbi:MAG: Holliday junction resolvase RuvX [Fibrobacteria bacterium]|nr:Holliday junction resolvase RuvX [Fibrobacteria bacterium]
MTKFSKSGRLLGLDYGERRIGVSISDPEGIIATGLTTIDCKIDTAPLDTIAKIITEKNVVGLVVGYPYQTDGLPGKKIDDVEKWIASLKKHFNLPIFRQDESYSSVMAQSSLKARRKKRKKPINKADIDRVAACFILQEFLNSEEC